MILQLFGYLIGALFFIVAAYNVIMKIIKGAADLLTSGVTTTQHDGRWNYHFYNPYGEMEADGGYLTETGALRAAQKRRNQIAKQLGNACGS